MAKRKSIDWPRTIAEEVDELIDRGLQGHGSDGRRINIADYIRCAEMLLASCRVVEPQPEIECRDDFRWPKAA